ncbi:alpha-amylase [Streptomyces sp. NPDC017943]|uniref:alpha-amylase n=1 Tax=Streptomyces sp. NPDC017943 TaxID=3365019 RepID=UPI00379C3A68
MIKRVIRAGVALFAVTLSSSVLSAPAAQATSLTPAPACVAVYESWRYLSASNNCGDTVRVKAVYQDGATGPCHTLAPGAVSTVGEGYLGQHGRVDHLALCEDV